MLASTLEQLRLDGAIFFRSEFSEPFSVDVHTESRGRAAAPGRRARAALPHRGGRRLLGERPRRRPAPGRGGRHHRGPVRGRPHADGGVARGAGVTRSPCSTPPPWSTMPTIEFGGEGATTSFVCGYLVSDDPLLDPRLRVFPPVFVVRLPEPAARQWVEASVNYAMQGVVPEGDATGRRRGHPTPRARRRRGLQGTPGVHAGRGPRMARGAPRPGARAGAGRAARRAGARWTVGRSRRRPRCRARCSTSGSGRCSGARPSGTSPSGGCTSPASCSRRATPRSSPMARRVGYDSEEAFSRAFKREHGASPGHWREARRNRPRRRRHERRGVGPPVRPGRVRLARRAQPLPPRPRRGPARRPRARPRVRRGPQRGVAGAAGLVGHRGRLLPGGGGEGRAARGRQRR